MEQKVPIRSREELMLLCGPYDRNLRGLRSRFDVEAMTRDGDLRVRGGRRQVAAAVAALKRMLETIRRDGDLGEEAAGRILGESDDRGGRRGAGRDGAADDRETGLASVLQEPSIFRRSFVVTPKTPGQAGYCEAIRGHDIVLGIGPAGTGKTFLAVAQAIEALRSGSVRRIVLVRPAVEAGERLGFLPGDYQAKVNPYLRPLYDALNCFLELGQLRRLIDHEVVEIVPLAYMRGRTLDEAFILLDEAQNTTPEQMKMFLTRMGQGSKIVVTGDVTQVDLGPGRRSGLIEVQGFLRGIPGIAFVNLGREDIVRHPLVQKIVDAYERWENKRGPQ